MKKILRTTVALLLLASLTIQADPFKTWNWSDPVTYENGQNIPGGDLINTTLHCGMQPGGPYPASQVFDMQVSPSIEDMVFVVAGVPGTYYCVATVSSQAHSTTSGYSNEIPFVVEAGSLGFVPNPPVLTLL